MHNAQIVIPLFTLAIAVLAFLLVAMPGKQARRALTVFTVAYLAFGVWCAFNVYRSDASLSDFFFVANHGQK